MKLTPYTLQKLVPFITGDNKLTPYQGAQALVVLFNSFGCKDLYKGGLPDGLSRKNYTEDRLNTLNSTPQLASLLEKLVNADFGELDRLAAVDSMNSLLNDEKFGLADTGGQFKVTGNVARVVAVVKNEVHFEQIQRQILAELDKAQFLIWVAVAWLTDAVLLAKLKERWGQGLSVQVLVNDDANNRKLPLDQYGFIRKLKPTGYFENMAHHKFCVIDLERSINGSYNWTVKAQYNGENIVISDDRAIAKRFAAKFIELKLEK